MTSCPPGRHNASTPPRSRNSTAPLTPPLIAKPLPRLGDGERVFDPAKPDGTPRKLLDVSRLQALGWVATIGLEEGLRDAYAWFREHGV